MRFQLYSDLHLEATPGYDVFSIAPAPGVRHLALIGDIGNTRDPRFFDFLRTQLAQFAVVFFLLGNHEPYHSSFPDSITAMDAFVKKTDIERTTNTGLGQFIFLNRTRWDVPGEDVTVLGCTLYSRITPQQRKHVSSGLNDFHLINDWNINAHNAAHATDLKWLNSQVAEIARNDPSRKVVVLSHHCPEWEDRSTDPKYAYSQLRSGFATDLRREICWKSPVVKLWAFGHTHFNCDFTEGEKRVVTNQRGYQGQVPDDFEERKVVEVWSLSGAWD